MVRRPQKTSTKRQPHQLAFPNMELPTQAPYNLLRLKKSRCRKYASCHCNIVNDTDLQAIKILHLYPWKTSNQKLPLIFHMSPFFIGLFQLCTKGTPNSATMKVQLKVESILKLQTILLCKANYCIFQTGGGLGNALLVCRFDLFVCSGLDLNLSLRRIW